MARWAWLRLRRCVGYSTEPVPPGWIPVGGPRGDGPRLGVPIRHTDRKREWAYDRQSHIGKLDKALDEAAERGWTVVNMKRDWNEVYPSKK